MWDENKVRIKDIAEELGVSTATVSNVLHGKTKKISDRTVKKLSKSLRSAAIFPIWRQHCSRVIIPELSEL